MKVVIVSAGVGKEPSQVAYSFVFEEAYRLAGRGIEVYIVRGWAWESDSFSYGMHYHGLKRKISIQPAKSVIENIPTYPLISLLRRPKSIYWENLYALKVSEVVEKNNINLIHAHFAYPEGFVGLLAKRRTNKPLIVTPQGYDIITEPNINYGMRLSKKYGTLVKAAIEGADVLIVNSDPAYREVLKIEPRAENKTHLIPLGADTKRFNPAVNGLPIRQKLGIEDKFVVFTLKSHEPRYRIEDVIKAAAIVKRHFKDAIFLIGGEGSLKNYHQNLSRKLGISDSVLFLGTIDYNEVPLYYAACDVLVNPALAEEFGICTAEAMATGKPVIAVRRHGSMYVVSDGINGFLVKPMSPKEIADKIIYFIENPKEVRRMGINGRKIAEEKFDMDRRIDRIVSLYKTLLDSYSN